MSIQTFKKEMRKKASDKGIKISFTREGFSIMIGDKYHTIFEYENLILAKMREPISLQEKNFFIEYLTELKTFLNVSAAILISDKKMNRKQLDPISKKEFNEFIGTEYTTKKHYIYAIEQSDFQQVINEVNQFGKEVEGFVSQCKDAKLLKKQDNLSFVLSVLNQKITVSFGIKKYINTKNENIETDSIYDGLFSYYHQNRLRQIF